MLGFFGAGASVPVAGMPKPDLLPFEDPGATNVLSHLLGFLCGVVFGALGASTRGGRLLQALPAGVAVFLALGIPAAAWGIALIASG